MRLMAFGGAVDERSAQAALDLARTQRVDRIVVFPLGPCDGLLAAVKREGRAASEVFLDQSAQWLLRSPQTSPQTSPPARVQPAASSQLTVVTDVEPAPSDRRLIHFSALVVELVGSYILLALSDTDKARDAMESAHIVVHGGPELRLEASSGHAQLCPGDLARGGSFLIVDGPPDPRVSVWSLDGTVTEARSLVLGKARLTVQGGAP